MRELRAFVGALSFAALVTAPTVARAEPDAAQRHFDAGRALVRAGR